MSEYKNKFNPLLSNNIQKVINDEYLPFDCTVGVGGDYATLSEALADNNTRIRIISDIVEIADNYIVDNTYINIGYFSIDFKSFKLHNGNSKKLIITNGDIKFINSHLFMNFTNDNLEVYNCSIYNQSTIEYNIITETGYFFNCKFYIPSTNYCGVGAVGTNDGFSGTLINCELILQNSQLFPIVCDIDCMITNLTISGTGNNSVLQIFNANNIFLDDNLTGIGRIRLGNINNYIDNDKHIQIEVFGNINNSTIYNLYKTSFNYSLINIIFTGSNSVRLNSNLIYDKCIFNENTSISYSNNKFINCTFLKGLEIQDDNNTVSNCNFTTDTITIDNTATNTKCLGNNTALDIVDNGIDTILSNNTTI